MEGSTFHTSFGDDHAIRDAGEGDAGLGGRPPARPPAEFATVGRPRPLPRASEENLLRIHQEILTNALRHSGAEVVKATLAFEVNSVRLEVQDDGGGFDPSERHDGAGLQGMRERLRQMDGELTIASRIGIGTRISVVLPDGRRGT